MRWGLWLSILVIAISAGFAISGKYKKQKFIHSAFKPLTMLMIISLAWERMLPVPSLYSYFLISGLCVSLLGDIFLMLPGHFFKPGLLAFLAGHIFYILAFVQALKLQSFYVLLPILAFGTIIYFLLHGKVQGLRVPILIYIGVISLMAWLAVNRYLFFSDQKSLFVCLGGILFLFSDSVNALNRFRKPFWLAQMLILGTYFAAQLAFALSI